MNAFRNQSFTNVSFVLGERVKKIGSAAFYGLTGLVSITMDGVTTVGSEAFYKTGLRVLNAPAMTTLGASAFSNCLNLTSIDLPRVVTVDATQVFSWCTNLKSVYFEDMMKLHRLEPETI
jgi:hypothetical protein